MSRSVSLFLAFASLAFSVPHFEYRAIALRANNAAGSSPSTSAVGAMPMVTDTNVFNLSSYCNVQRTSFYNSYNPTNSLTTSTITDYQGFDDTGNQTGSIVTQTYSTRTLVFTEEANVAYANGGAKPPCCSTCRINAGTIQFYWWPDLATATKTITKSANSSGSPVTAVAPNGFIFTSPSVYMAFSSIYAENWCSTVGEAWYNTTIGFRPNEMTTINAYTTTFSSYSLSTEDGEVESVYITDRGYQPPPSPLKYSDLAQNCSSLAGYVYFPDDPQNDAVGSDVQDPCHPILVIPDSLISMQPAWVDNHCRAGNGYGAYDPPQALTAAANEAKPTMSASAQPGNTGSSSSAPLTTSYTAQPDTQPTSSAASSSSTSASETTYVIGGGSSSSSFTVYPSPVVASSASALDPASRSDGPTLKSPNVQPTASQLDAPSRTSSVGTVTSHGVQAQSSDTRAYKPQLESSETAVVVPGNSNRPLESGSATHIIGPVSTYTVVHETTEANGQVSVVTHTTELQLLPMQTAGPSDVGSAAAYTILQESTLANGGTITVSTVISVPTGAYSQQGTTQAAVIAVGGQTYTADASSNFVISGQTISAEGATVTINETPIALLAGGETAIVGGSTISLAAVTQAADSPPPLTIGTDILSANPAGGYVVAPGTTLSIGGSSVTVDNTAYALKTNDAGETMLVAGAATTSTSSINIGHYIMSAIQGTNATSSRTSHTSSTTNSPSRTGASVAAAPDAPTSTATGDAVVLRTSMTLVLFLLMRSVIRL